MHRLQSWKFDKRKASSPLGPLSLAISSFLALSAGALADDLALSSVPPYFVPSVEPNLIVSVEYSGIMHSGRLPWDLPTDALFRVTPMATASEVNTLYYDPQITYLPAIDADGNQMDHGVFGAALRSVFIEGAGICLLDLSQQYEAVLIEAREVCLEEVQPFFNWESVYARNTRNPDYGAETLPNEWPFNCQSGAASCAAYYNVFDPAADPSCPSDLSTFDLAALTAQSQAIEAETDPTTKADLETAYAADLAEWTLCFRTTDVGSNTDIGSGQPGELSTEALEQRRAALQEDDTQLPPDVLAKRNFANWYVYHRTVGRSEKTALSRSMDGLGSNVRVTYHPKESEDLHGNLAVFSGDGRTDFYEWLFALNPDQDAPTWKVSATLAAGEFASTESAYRTDLDVPLDSLTNPALSCRNNLHLLVSASPWVARLEAGGEDDCGFVVPPPVWLGNNDETPVMLPEDACDDASSCQAYDGRPPFGDGNTGMLADIVFHYWSTDLRPGLLNDVPALISDASGDTDADNFWIPDNDPANWQHLTTFSVGMDLRGSVDDDSGDYVDGGVAKNIVDDGFPGSINAIGKCSADWDSGEDPNLWYPEYNLDDIWHAGVNGRGGYVNATNATDLLAALTAVTDQVANAAGSSSTSSEALSTGVLFNGDMVYQTVMSPLDWSGDLRIIQISHGLGQQPCSTKALGELCQDVAAGQEPYHSAADELAGQDWTGGVGGRQILTRSDTQEFAFRSDTIDDATNWDLLTADQQAALKSGGDGTDDIALAKARISFLRGDRSNEASQSGTYSFRDRAELIGDVIGSTPPVVVGAPYRFYQDHGYLTPMTGFRDTHANRTEVVYVGANDGMLHAFDATLGTELFAYVPRMVFDGLADLTMSGYGSDPAHRNFVDGPMVEGDAYFGGDWYTVLVVSAGLGAKGLFALDVTNPAGREERTVLLDGSSVIPPLSMWELTDNPDPNDAGTDNLDLGDPNIGYVLGRPSIVRICPDEDADSCITNAQWVVVFGNGYNSSPGEAVLFVRAIADGSSIAIYKTGKNREDDPLIVDDDAIGRANGLAQPTVVDYDGDLVADAAYAGDLFGSLWKFDLTRAPDLNATPPNPVRLFTALDSTGVAQPIMTPPAVLRHPLGTGVLVIFGTGKLLEAADISDSQVQTIYAIWDDGVYEDDITRSDLLQQHLIVSDVRVGTVSNARVVSNESIVWAGDDRREGWYLDLVPVTVDPDTLVVTIPAPGSSTKERIIGAPQLDFNRLIFTTLTPSADRCAAGGSSWVNIIDARNGSRLEAATFDLDLDGGIGTSDLLDVADSGDAVPASSMQLVTAGSEARGIYTSPASLALEAGKEIKGLTTGEGSPTADETFKKWRVWRKIR